MASYTEDLLKNIATILILLLACLAFSPSPAPGAERGGIKTNSQSASTMTLSSTPVKPAISEMSLLRSQLALLRQDLEKEKAAREKLQTEMQNKIDLLVGLLNLTSQKVTKLQSHTHEYSGAPFGFITKAGFGNIPADALIPYVAQEKVGKGVTLKTGPPIQ